MPVSIRNLARQLNLSITTVSRALNGYSDVSESTRVRVAQAARELGYLPSSAARQLRRRRSDTIGYIFPAGIRQTSDPFYADFLSGLCDEASGSSIDLVTASYDVNIPSEDSVYRRWYQSGRVDGLVLDRIRIRDWRLAFLAENHIPFVGLGSSAEAPEYPGVVVDDRGGFDALVHHLVDRGHRRIAYIGTTPRLVSHTECLSGYFQGLQSAGLPIRRDLVVQTDLSEQGGYLAAYQMLNRPDPPTAILGSSDWIALGAMKAARDSGRVLGKDLAVAGQGGTPEAEWSNPRLTTLVQPSYEIGRKLAAMLIALVNGEKLSEPRQTLHLNLRIRESTG
jgi:LacI family transcriptional regulator